MAAMESGQIVPGQAAHALHLAAFVQGIGMIPVQRRLEGLRADGFRFGGGLLQGGDDPGLFPFQDGRVESGRGENGAEQG
jgi:hypothetical protein